MSQSQHSQVISPQSEPPVSSVTGDASLPATTVLQSTTLFMKLMCTYSGTLICYYLAAGILFCSGPLFCGYGSVSIFIWNEPMIFDWCSLFPLIITVGALAPAINLAGCCLVKWRLSMIRTVGLWKLEVKKSVHLYKSSDFLVLSCLSGLFILIWRPV